MSTAAWTPVNESAWTPVPEENPEAVAAANPPVAKPFIPMKQWSAIGPDVVPLQVHPNAPVNAAVLNLNHPFDRNYDFTKPTTYNDYERESGRDIGTVAGGMGVGGLVPKGWGALGKYIVKPIVSGAGAGAGSLTGGATPTEAATTGGQVAAGETLFGALGAGMSRLLDSGLLGEGTASYFAKGENGKFIPTDKLNDIKTVHEAFGIKPGDLSLKPGAMGTEGAYKIPAESMLERSGLTAKQIAQKTPDELGQIVEPLRKQAGDNITRIVDEATKNKVTIDAGKIIKNTIADMLDPQGEQALAKANDIGKQLGIKDWRKVTPKQMLAYRQAIYDLPPRFSDRLYGPVTRALKEAVPEIVPEDKAFSEFSALRDAATELKAKSMTRVSPTKFEELLQLMRAHPAIAGATGLGGTVSGAMGLYQGGRAAYDWATGR
jgi:hypothetical protein